jgi:ElaB/YqjD/DUF883 family membrane-anchored ribosome-binding protein
MPRTAKLEDKTAELARTPHQGAADGARALAEGADALREQARDSAHEIGDAAAQEAARVGDLVRGWVQSQSQQARRVAAAARDEAAAARERAARYVGDEPLKSVLLAAAAGALITGLVVFASSRRGHR